MTNIPRKPRPDRKASHQSLRTDPRDVGCEQAMDVLDTFVDAVIKDGAGTHREAEHAPRRETAGTEPVRLAAAEQPAAYLTHFLPVSLAITRHRVGAGNRTSIWRPPLRWPFALRAATIAWTMESPRPWRSGWVSSAANRVRDKSLPAGGLGQFAGRCAHALGHPSAGGRPWRRSAPPSIGGRWQAWSGEVENHWRSVSSRHRAMWPCRLRQGHVALSVAARPTIRSRHPRPRCPAPPPIRCVQL